MDSLKRNHELYEAHVALVKQFNDSLVSVQKRELVRDAKIEATAGAVSQWSIYCGILVGVLLTVLAGTGYLSYRSAREVAFKEMREVKEELDKELLKVKRLGVEANQEFTSFNTMLKTLEGAAKTQT